VPTPRIRTGSTPEGSVIVSISMPHAGGKTEKSSLRTIPSVSTRTETDLGRDLERLADDLRAYDQTIGLENQELGDNIQALRDELRDLAAFLTWSPPRPPSPPSIVSVASEPYQHPQVQLRIKLVKVTRPGIEPRTFWTYTKCSNQLSYPAIPQRTSFSMIPQTIRGGQPCAQISISDSPCRPYVNLVTA
jgi:hypothetical protein